MALQLVAALIPLLIAKQLEVLIAELTPGSESDVRIDRLHALSMMGAVGMGICLLGTLLGVVLASMALFGNGNRERWFQVGIIGAAGVTSFFWVPFGFLVGGIFAVGLIRRWKEFRPSAGGKAAALPAISS